MDIYNILHLNIHLKLCLKLSLVARVVIDIDFFSFLQILKISISMSRLETTTEDCPPLARRHAQHEEEGHHEEEDDGTAHVHRRADPGDGHCTVEL